MEIATLIAAWIAVLVGAPPALRELGLDVRIFGRSKPVPPEAAGFKYTPLGRRSWFPLVLSSVGVLLAGFATYYFFKPRIRIVEKPVEKVVEKPVDRVVEKQTPCPTQKPDAKPVPTNPHKQRLAIPQLPKQSCPNGICIGGENSGTATVNNFAPPQRILDQANSKKFTDSLKACGQYRIGMRHANGNEESSKLAGQFEEAIKAAEWTFIRPKFLIQENEGHGIFVLGPNTPEDTPAAICLERALANIGVNVATTKVDDLSETDLYVGLR